MKITQNSKLRCYSSLQLKLFAGHATFFKQNFQQWLRSLSNDSDLCSFAASKVFLIIVPGDLLYKNWSSKIFCWSSPKWNELSNLFLYMNCTYYKLSGFIQNHFALRSKTKNKISLVEFTMATACTKIGKIVFGTKLKTICDFFDKFSQNAHDWNP